MPKKVVQDVVAPRTIRQVHIRKLRDEEREDEVIREAHEQHEHLAREPKETKRHRKTSGGRGGSFFKWAIVGICFVVVFFALSLVYASATVKVKPKSETVNIDNSYMAKRDAGPDDLQYEMMTLAKQDSREIEATGTAQAVSSKAHGKVTLYNEYSDKPQKMIASTRLENSSGLIYRLDAEVSIPGYKIVAGKKVAGSVAALVSADKPGAQYNIKLADLSGDFKVTAYKTDPARKDLFYARLASDISGGSSGMKVGADPAKVSAAKNEMDNALSADLKAQAAKQVPENYVLFDGANIFKYDTIDGTSTPGKTVLITEKATLDAIIFKKEDLVRYVAKKTVEKYKGRFTQSGLENLEFRLSPPNSGGGDRSINFSLKGDFTVIGTFPAAELKEKLVDKSVNDIGAVMSQYGTIVSADVVIRPFWKRTFPNSVDKITIETASK